MMSFFRNLQKEKELIDRELAVYKQEKLVEITFDVARAQEKGAKQECDYECTWHSRKEKLDIELATLEARKDTYKSGLEKSIEVYERQYQAVFKAKDEHIESLEKANANLAAAIQKLQNTQVIK